MDDLALHLGLGLALGLLVGLQREWVVDRVAGIRTFPLITLLGVLLSALGPVWLTAAGLLSLGILLGSANVARSRSTPDADFGVTTEVAALVMFGVGVLLGRDMIAPAVVLGGSVAVLLQWKAQLHALTHRLADGDLEAITRLVLVALVILPLVPDRDFGPWQVINPFHIWLMVVLIVSISLAGYVALRLFGARGGAFVSGVLGGLISSTATTLSYARQSRGHGPGSVTAALVIVVASGVVFARVLVEIALVAPQHLFQLAPPLVAMAGMIAVVATGLAFMGGEPTVPSHRPSEPPTELGSAILFGLLYAGVLLAVAFARHAWGEAGLYGVAALSGLTDVDAITLSTSRLIAQGGLEVETGWRVILVGALANLVFKAGLVALLADRALKQRVTAAFGAALLGGVALLVFWP